MRALRILLVDDEPLARRRLRTFLKAIPDVQVVGEAADGHEARRLMGELEPDLVLLDIKMPGQSGVELFASLQGQQPVVVFVTAFARFATDAFDLAATDYLLKPVEPERLRVAVERARVALAARERSDEVGELRSVVAKLRSDPLEQAVVADGEIWVRDKGDRVVFPISALDWVEAERDYVRLHCGPKSYLLRQPISAFARRLDPEAFVQVHRSAIVRRARIERVRRERRRLSIVLSTGHRVPVSRPYAKLVRSLTRRGGKQAAGAAD